MNHLKLPLTFLDGSKRVQVSNHLVDGQNEGQSDGVYLRSGSITNPWTKLMRFVFSLSHQTVPVLEQVSKKQNNHILKLWGNSRLMSLLEKENATMCAIRRNKYIIYICNISNISLNIQLLLVQFEMTEAICWRVATKSLIEAVSMRKVIPHPCELWICL